MFPFHNWIVGSVVECSPATRAARVRFPDDALLKTYMFAGAVGNMFDSQRMQSLLI